MSPDTRGETFVMKEEASTTVEFSAIVLGMAATALMHLGETPNPETGQAQKDIIMARQTLDLLGVLRTKTQGNLTLEEQKLFDELLSDLRLRFVEALKK